MEHKNQAPRLDGQTILQIIPGLETGGAERTTLEIGQAIVAAGGTSLVVSEGGQMVPQLEAEGSVHVTLPVASKNPLVMWQNRARLIALIREHGVALVHARSRAPAWSALWAARATGRHFVTTYHGIYNAKTAPKRLYNSAMARGDQVIANSQFTADAVAATYGTAQFFDPARLQTIPRGADLSRFDPALVTHARAQAALSAFGDSDMRILLPGRLTSWKGQMVAIKAAGLLQRQDPASPFKIVMIGSAQGRDQYQAALAAAIAEEEVTERVAIYGHWEDMPAAYDWANLTLSTSTRPEAFGRVAIEAQAMGCPVIASAHGGAMETVLDGETGSLVPPGDGTALAGAIRTYMQLSQEQRMAWSKQAKLRARHDFSIEAMTGRTLSVYKLVLNDVGQDVVSEE